MYLPWFMGIVPKKDIGAQLASDCADALQPERVVTVLAVSPIESDHLFLRTIFSHSKWQIHSARSWAEAQAFLATRLMPVVLCESELEPGTTWKDVLAGLAARPDPPALVVTSRTADEYLWAEVLNLGGYDLLAKPFDRDELVRVVAMAARHGAQKRARAEQRPPRSLAVSGAVA